jgi:hypothetical protein
MAKVSRIHASRFVKAYELSYTDRRPAIIDGVTTEMFGINPVEKLVSSISDGYGWGKDMVLNQTNAQRLVSVFGDETDEWAGQPVELWVVDVDYNGSSVQSVQIGPAPPAIPPAPPAALPATPALAKTLTRKLQGKEIDDEIPY